MLCKYASDYSEESYQSIMKSEEGVGTFQSIAVPRKIDFDIVQNLHPKTLIGIWFQRQGCQKIVNAFHLAMQRVTDKYGARMFRFIRKSSVRTRIERNYLALGLFIPEEGILFHRKNCLNELIRPVIWFYMHFKAILSLS